VKGFAGSPGFGRFKKAVEVACIQKEPPAAEKKPNRGGEFATFAQLTACPLCDPGFCKSVFDSHGKFRAESSPPRRRLR